jgi:hypothetical protein
MLENPFLPSPSEAAAWSEGFRKGLAAIASPEPGEDVGPDDIDAFNQGVEAGVESQSEGMEFSDPCIPAAEEHGPGHVPGMVINGFEIAHGVWEVRHLTTLAAGIAGILVALIELACTLPVHTLPPEDVLPNLGQPIVDALADIGVDSMELFCGAGLDPTATDCEIQVSSLFISLDQARDAAIAMDRFQWVVVSWRTDQSGSFRVADSGDR